MVGPEFNFVTRLPFNANAQWPALSRAWNQTFSVIDHESIVHHNYAYGVWGSGFHDEHTKHLVSAVQHVAGRNARITLDILPPGGI